MPRASDLRVPGRLKAVKAIGWTIEQYRQAQVSINLLSYRTTPLHEVFETTREEAAKLGLVVTGSELVGLTPLEPLVEAGRYYLRKQGRSTGLPERELVELAIQSLGLAQLSPFDPDKRVIEYAVRMPAPLVSMTVERFVDEVSSNSPAPGGGSVAALAGSLGAALAAMVANLTVGKAGYESAWTSSSALAERAQALKAALLAAVDEDTKAFDDVLAAMRLPKAHGRTRSARGRKRSRAPTRRQPPCRSRRRGCAWQAIELAAEAARPATGIPRRTPASVPCSPRQASSRRPERPHQPAVRAGRRVQGRRRSPRSPICRRNPPARLHDARRSRGEPQDLTRVRIGARVLRRRDHLRSRGRNKRARLGDPPRLARALNVAADPARAPAGRVPRASA